MELSPLTQRIVGEFIMALSSFTPENIRACGEAKAAALKLTEPERQKREECVAIIDSVAPKLRELEGAEATHAAALAVIKDGNAKLLAREAAITKRENDHAAAIKAVTIRETAATVREKELDDYSDRLEAAAKGHKDKQMSLKEWEDSLKEEAGNIEKAQQLIKKK